MDVVDREWMERRERAEAKVPKRSNLRLVDPPVKLSPRTGGKRYRYRIFRIQFSLRDGETGRWPLRETYTSDRAAQQACFAKNVNEPEGDGIFVVVKEER